MNNSTGASSKRRKVTAALLAIIIFLVVAAIHFGTQITAQRRTQRILSDWGAPGMDQELSALAIGSQSPDVQIQALHRLGDRIVYLLPVSKEAWGQVIDALRDENTEVREKAAHLLMLGAIVRPPHRQASLAIPVERLPELLEATRDTSPRVRAQIPYVLASMESQRALAGLAALADDRDESVRSAVAEGLGLVAESQHAGAIRLLRRLKSDECPLVQVVAIWAAQRIGDPVNDDDAQQLIVLLLDPHDTVRVFAAVVMGQVGSAEFAGPLRQAVLADSDAQVRFAALNSLGKIGGTTAKRTLEEILSSTEYSETFQTAAKALLAELTE